MATSPAPDAAAPPGMCPGIAVLGGGGAGGDGDGDGSGGKDGGGGNGKGKGDGASGDGKSGGCAEGDPICPITGRMFLKIYDFGFGGPLPLRFLRSYSSRGSDRDGEFGYGWSHTFGWRVRVRRQSIEVYDEDARAQIVDPLPMSGGSVKNALGWVLSGHGDELSLRIPRDGLVCQFGLDVGGGWHELASITDRNGNTITVERDAKGALVGLIDSAGRPYRFQTDRKGRVVQASVATDVTHQHWMDLARYTYDDEGNLASVTDAEGFTAGYSYDGHLMTEHRSVSGLSYCYRYDGGTARARCVESWGEFIGKVDPALAKLFPVRPAGRDTRKLKGINHVRLTYLESQRYTEVENGLGGVTRYFGDELGRAVKIVDAAGGVTEKVFDPATGGLVAEQDQACQTRHIACDEGGAPAGYIGPDGKGFTPRADANGDEVTFDSHHGVVIRRRRDARGNLVFIAYPDGTSEEWEVDSRGIHTRFINRLGTVTTFEHDAMGNCVVVHSPGERVERMEYDYLGRRTAHLDPAGNRTEWAWDRRSEVVVKRFPNGAERRAVYDANRKLVELADRGQVTRYEYGGIGWCTRILRPSGATIDFRYDVEGNLVSIKNPRGQTFRIERDFVGRAVAYETFEGARHSMGRNVQGQPIWLDGPAGRISIEHDDMQRVSVMSAPDGDITFEHSHDGITKVDNGSVLVEREYDVLGRVVRDVQGRHENRVEWAGGELASVASNVGLPVAFTYGTAGDLSAITAGSTEFGLRAAAGKDLLSRLGDGLLLRQQYDANGSLVHQCLARRRPDVQESDAATSTDPNVVFRASYEYDAADRLRREWRSDGRTIEYDLDADGHVTSKRTWRDGKVVDEERIAYDAAGSPRMDGARYDALARPVALDGEELMFDDSGRLLKRLTDAGEWRYEWSSLDQLVKVHAPTHLVEMDYDADGRRMRKRVLRQSELVSSTSYVWTNNVVLHEVDDLDGSTRTYLRPNEEWSPLGHVDVRAGQEAATYYILTPGSAIDFAVDSGGNVVWEAAQTIYGHAVPTTAKVPVSARFPNQFHDPDVELTYNLHRWYEPRLGVYASIDPWILEGNLNPRDYAPNPFSFCDPTGAMTFGVGDGTGTDGFHPTPPGKAGQSPPKTSDDINPTTEGHWGTPGHKSDKGGVIPGYAKCPTNALHEGTGVFGSDKDPKSAQSIVDKAGKNYGCHGCGAKTSGFSGNDGNHWCCDHVPPLSTYKEKNHGKDVANQATSDNVRLYPHCKECMVQQRNKLAPAKMPIPEKLTAGQAGFKANTPLPKT